MAMLRWSSLGRPFGQLTSPSGAFFDWHRNDPFDGFDSVLFGAMASAADGCLRFVFAMSPISSRRRMASGRDGNGGSCSAIQASSRGGWMRTTSGSPLLIAVGPVFLWNHFLFFMS
jgi:hypothetical protein